MTPVAWVSCGGKRQRKQVPTAGWVFFIPAVTKSNHNEAAQYLSLHAMTRIILVRHGQTEWNRVERFRGRADIPLNETGLAQAEATGRRIAAGWRPAAVYSSPLSRAVKTAMAVAGHFDLPVLTHAGLIDIDYGKWQGLTPDEARDRWPRILDAWYTAPDASHIPGGETLAALRTRAMEALKGSVNSSNQYALLLKKEN